MTENEVLDVFFEELDWGPRWVLRETFGAPSPEAEAATQKALRAETRSETKETPGLQAPAHLQKKSENATFSEAPSPVRERLPMKMPPPSRELNAPLVSAGDVGHFDWPALEGAIRDCKACVLCRQRRQAVSGVGDRQADWLFVGEGPGLEEDMEGEPFVGQSGKLLDNMLLAIGLKRGENVYIGNAVKCRPPNNRTPEPGEVDVCRPYLERQIALLQPKLIVLLGRTAALSVLKSDESLSALRGKVHRYGEIPVVVTYHPAYLLRTLHDKAKAWEDLCLARRTMQALGA